MRSRISALLRASKSLPPLLGSLPWKDATQVAACNPERALISPEDPLAP